MYERFPNELCASYAAGHQMHWVHWKQTLAAEPIRVELRFMDDEKVGILLAPTRRALTYWHHDMARMRDVIGLGLPIVAFRELHALKVGECLFNCSNQPLRSLCRSTPHRQL
jgi:hypothetical protein